MPMMKTKLTPLELFRQEKEKVRRECAEKEGRLAEHWAYLSDHAGSLIFQSAIDGILHHFGFGSKRKSKEDSGDTTNNGFLTALTTYYPVIWEFLQPVLIRFVIKKIKSIFSRRKKK